MTPASVAGRLRSAFRTRAALGLRPVAAPVMVFIPLGIVLGPGVLGVLSTPALAHLDIVISIALATLGVFIGIAAGRDLLGAGRLLAAATVEAGVTILVVFGATLALMHAWGLPLDVSYVLGALALAVGASASAAPTADALEDQIAAHVAIRVADLDDVMPIVIGGMVLVMAGPTTRPVLQSAGLTIGLGLAIGFGGWLLVERAYIAAERGVFVLGVVAMLGGAPAYMGLSPMLAGLAAGLFWVAAPGRCDVIVARELRKVQHPIVVLLLITAGASLEWTRAGIWLLAPYVIFRTSGKILGGWTASRFARGMAPSDLGAHLLHPGVIGIAFALNIRQVAPESAPAIVFAVAAGAIAAEAIAILVAPGARTA